MATYTAFGNLYGKVSNLESANPIKSITFDDTSKDLTITKYDNSSFPIALDVLSSGGGGSAPSYKVAVVPATNGDALTDAKADYIGILTGLTGTAATADEELELYDLSASGATVPTNGTALRFFVYGSAETSAQKYRLYYKNAGGTEVDVVYMRNGEAYTLAYNTAQTKFIVIPGIINAKSK